MLVIDAATRRAASLWVDSQGRLLTDATTTGALPEGAQPVPPASILVDDDGLVELSPD